ncbi:MAG: immunoglobulin domain-containing protein [Verrucomicrobiia bacterium]
MKTRLCITVAGLLLTATSPGVGQPVITQQPQSSTNLVGTTAIFTAAATGTLPLAYQWQRDSGDGWLDLPDSTNTTLVFPAVKASDAGAFQVVVTNVDGAATSAVAHLTIPVPPEIKAATSLQHQAVDAGTRASFRVTALGTPPLAYQWRLDGHDLANQTNATLSLSNVQPAEEGDYTVVVTNLAGVASSAPARLWVTPPFSEIVTSNFTNSLGRLPYFYLSPTDYNDTKSYPLYLSFHGTPGDESYIRASIIVAGWRVMGSYGQQARDPVITLWPTRRAGDASWTEAYLRQVSALLDQFITRFNVNTNRIYITGGSEGLHAAWDLIAMRPGFFAGATLLAGWKGSHPAALVKDVPVWAWCAANDEAGQLGNTRLAVGELRAAGGSVRYTEYATGGHGGAIGTGALTPTIVEWLLAQRRGVPSTAEPLLTITNPTAQVAWSTGATNLSLAGSALALDQDVTQVAWTNTANKLTGVAEGFEAWSVADIPLVAGKTNGVIVTGTTASWAPTLGGTTTFSQTLMVVCSPIQATLTLDGTTALLNWIGGGPPYQIQRATDLLAADWTEVQSDAAPPVLLPVTGPSSYYRIIGQ